MPFRTNIAVSDAVEIALAPKAKRHDSASIGYRSDIRDNGIVGNTTNYLGVGIAIGVGLGAALGAALHNISVPVAIGATLGAVFGLLLNKGNRNSTGS